MSNPNVLLSKQVCRYLGQSRTLKDILMRTAHWTAHFEFGKLNLAKPNALKVFECNCDDNRRDKLALRTTSIKNVTFKIIKTRTSFPYLGYFYYSVNLNWTAQNPQLGRMRPAGLGLDIADLNTQVD